ADAGSKASSRGLAVVADAAGFAPGTRRRYDRCCYGRRSSAAVPTHMHIRGSRGAENSACHPDATSGGALLSNGLPDDVTGILDRLNEGDRAAVTTLLPVVYADLRRLADQFFRRERRDHTLQPTALVHEAYLRLMESPNGRWASREHFFRAAAVVMRHILVNHARMKGSIKRGGGREQASIDDALAVFEERAVDLVA